MKATLAHKAYPPRVTKLYRVTYEKFGEHLELLTEDERRTQATRRDVKSVEDVTSVEDLR